MAIWPGFQSIVTLLTYIAQLALAKRHVDVYNNGEGAWSKYRTFYDDLMSWMIICMHQSVGVNYYLLIMFLKLNNTII